MMKDNHQIYHGDCIEALKQLPDNSVTLFVTSPPYAQKKAYEDTNDGIKEFIALHEKLLPEIYRTLKPGGFSAWQTGYNVRKGAVVPLDIVVYNIFHDKTKRRKFPLTLCDRFVWHFGSGLHCKYRFSGRHEMISLYCKGREKETNLMETYGSVWDIPNVKHNHPEKTVHPCSFPSAIPMRLIKSLTREGDLVVDPFCGAGITGCVAVMQNRRFYGAERCEEYACLAESRIELAKKGELALRPDVPPMEPGQRIRKERKKEI